MTIVNRAAAPGGYPGERNAPARSARASIRDEGFGAPAAPGPARRGAEVGRLRPFAAALAATLLASTGAAAPSPGGIGPGAPPLALLDVRAFGARCDGKSDDRGAIQAAIDAAV